MAFISATDLRDYPFANLDNVLASLLISSKPGSRQLSRHESIDFQTAND